MSELLIEIFTEELPAIPLLKNIDSIKTHWQTILKEYRLESDFDFFYTPRRLVLLHENFAKRQTDIKTKSYGPPISICYDNNNNPTRAMQSFLTKNNITRDEVTTSMKDNKEVLFYEKIENGLESTKLIADMVKQWLLSLNFGKSMRWGDCKESFVRPIRNICILFDGESISCSMYGVNGSNNIVAHRQALDLNQQTKQQAIVDIRSYLSFLKQNGVILQQGERREYILQKIMELEKQNGIKVELDTDLLDEIVAITEYPVVLFGRFEKRFLKIPKEMIITSMKENQRYFAVYKDGNLHNGFIVVSNSFNGDSKLIIKGNEKVLKARLQDAEFFYENDLKMQMNFGDLSSIGFMDGAGSLQDKVCREEKLALRFIELLNNKNVNTNDIKSDSIKKAIRLAKCDLLSQSVGEFPELQGIMGANFAEHIGIQEDICNAIREQYLPNGLDNTMPTQILSAIVNIAIKLDTIFTLFNLNKIPSGSKDPFALRRQSIAILRICHKFNFDVNIQDLCLLAINDYKNIKQDVLNDFIADRIYGIFPNINASIVRCVVVRNFGISQSFNKILALSNYLEHTDIKSIISTFKRVANILQDNKMQQDNINTSLFENIEKVLYDNLLSYINSKNKQNKQVSYDKDYYLSQIESIFKLKEDLDNVFDNVLINTDDSVLKANRVALISLVFKEFMAFGDMREITIG